MIRPRPEYAFFGYSGSFLTTSAWLAREKWASSAERFVWFSMSFHEGMSYPFLNGIFGSSLGRGGYASKIESSCDQVAFSSPTSEVFGGLLELETLYRWGLQVEDSADSGGGAVRYRHATYSRHTQPATLAILQSEATE